MATPTNTAHPSPSQPPGRISSSPRTLTTWDTSLPILRFDFAIPAAQATFHRAFLQVRSEKDKATFMTRFFDNYDGQVSIPRRVFMDMSRDEEVARRLFEDAPPPPTHADEEVARRLQERMNGGGFGAGGVRRAYDGEGQRRYGVDGGGYDGGVDSIEDRVGRMSFRVHGGHGQYPGPYRSGYAPRRHPRLQPRYSENENEQFGSYDGCGDGNSSAYAPGNGRYGYEYDPRYGNRGCRGGRY